MIHISVNRPICGVSGLSLSLSTLIRFHPITFWVMRLFGCRNCGEELRDALRSARPIR